MASKTMEMQGLSPVKRREWDSNPWYNFWSYTGLANRNVFPLNDNNRNALHIGDSRRAAPALRNTLVSAPPPRPRAGGATG